MPRRPKRKPDPDNPESTALVSLRKSTNLQSDQEKDGGSHRSSSRHRFLKAFEFYYGNVTAACHAAGIHRTTYYRWLESPTRVNQKFRKQLARIKPDERLIDEAEFTITQGLKAGDITAAIFTLKTKGRYRGWNERPENLAVLEDLIDRVASAYRMWLEDHPDAEMTEKIKWLNRFAENGKVQPRALAKKVGIPLESDSVN